MTFEKKMFIYGLRELGSDPVHYVGKTIDKKQRLKAHIVVAKSGATTPVYLWISGVLESGGTVEMVVLQECHEDDVNMAEKEWIDAMVASGHPLKNVIHGPMENSCRQAAKETESRPSSQVRAAVSLSLPVSAEDPVEEYKLIAEALDAILSLHRGVCGRQVTNTEDMMLSTMLAAVREIEIENRRKQKI